MLRPLVPNLGRVGGEAPVEVRIDQPIWDADVVTDLTDAKMMLDSLRSAITARLQGDRRAGAGD
jgi:hypothetical protein